MGAAKRRQQALGAAYGTPPAWAWHYTLGRYMPLIAADGALRDAWTDANRHRIGGAALYSIWFTTAQVVDPTSTPAYALRDDCKGDQELFKATFGGHWRIGAPCSHPLLLTYQQALAQHDQDTVAGQFLRNLPRAGENRNHWRLALEPVPLIGCRIEELQGERWVAHPLESLCQAPAAPRALAAAC